MKSIKIPLLSAFSAVLIGCASQSPALKNPMLISGFNPNLTAQELKQQCDNAVDTAKTLFTALENDASPATMASVFGQFDAISLETQKVQHVWHLKAVHPEADIRDAASACGIQISDLYSGFGMSRKLYERVAKIDTSNLSEVEKKIVQDSLESFKQAGVDKDETTRNQIRALRKEISEIGNTFSKNISEDTRYVETHLSKLDGLPQDYIDAKAKTADANGNIKISTNYPDIRPVMQYAHNDELRRKLRVAARSRGYPQNEQVLKSLIEKRHQLANILGYPNWASMSMNAKMIKTPANAQDFLDKIGAALKEPVKREMQERLTRLQKIDPSAKRVEAWQASYLADILVREEYALDSKEVREYFAYNKVRGGIFKLTEDLFGVSIEPWKTETWHEEVETYQIVENGQIIGRFYMDNHPRDNKYKHAAHWTIRTGLKNRQIPVSALAQNFPRGDELMTHGQVETFLHEFGHLLHNMFSGGHDYFAVAGMSAERDTVEAPSQLLEEWVWDYDTLKNFATNSKGEVIPRELVAKMVRARDFGKAIATATQVYYANLSLNYYSRDPSTFELMPLMREISDKFNPYPFVEGTAFFANFGHLNGYSSDYYTYQWSLAIATDLFSRFKKEGMRNTDVSRDYRYKVLGAGGSKPAAEFIKDFLGRDFSPDAYINKLKGE